MVLRDVQRMHPDDGYVLEHVRDWQVTEQLRLVIGSLSRRNVNHALFAPPPPPSPPYLSLFECVAFIFLERV